MALFGAPKAHDDDPLRAARAALEIHEALAQLTDSRKRPLQSHVGIASGEVVAGSLDRGSARDYTVLGDSVNLAARLVASAGARPNITVQHRLPRACRPQSLRRSWRNPAQRLRYTHARLAIARDLTRSARGQSDRLRWAHGRA